MHSTSDPGFGAVFAGVCRYLVFGTVMAFAGCTTAHIAHTDGGSDVGGGTGGRAATGGVGAAGTDGGAGAGVAGAGSGGAAGSGASNGGGGGLIIVGGRGGAATGGSAGGASGTAGRGGSGGSGGGSAGAGTGGSAGGGGRVGGGGGGGSSMAGAPGGGAGAGTGGEGTGGAASGGAGTGGAGTGGAGTGGAGTGGAATGGAGTGGAASGGAGGMPAPAPSLPGQVVISEIMVDTVVAMDDFGEWFEIHNPSTSVTYDLAGCRIADSGQGNSQMISRSLVIPPGGFITLGITDVAADLGFVPTYSYASALKFGNSGDYVLLTCNSVMIDIVDYTTFTIPNGRSLSLDPRHFSAVDNDVANNWCRGETVYVELAGMRDYGTPGSGNHPLCATAAP